MKCKVRNRILLQFSAQYQNMSLPFDCAYSGCESRLTMPVLTQQTDRVCAACQWAGILNCQCWSWHCYSSHSETWKLTSRRMYTNLISSLLGKRKAKAFLRFLFRILRSKPSLGIKTKNLTPIHFYKSWHITQKNHHFSLKTLPESLLCFWAHRECTQVTPSSHTSVSIPQTQMKIK